MQEFRLVQHTRSHIRPHGGDVQHFNRPLFSLSLLQHAHFCAKVAMEMDFNVRIVIEGSSLFIQSKSWIQPEKTYNTISIQVYSYNTTTYSYNFS